MDVLMRAEGLLKVFPVRGGGVLGRRRELRAVDGVDLTIGYGETVALVGESGSGKSTLGRTLLRLVDPTAGRIELEGRDITHLSQRELRPLRRRMQMVFQNPHASLNPYKKIRSILRQPILTHTDATRRQADAQACELLEQVGLTPPPTFMERYPNQLSGGQRQRVGIARAISLSPGLVVADEAVSALDMSVRSQILELLMGLKKEHGLAYLFITHDLAVARYIADRVMVLYLGQVVEEGPTDRVLRAPKHPYTKALLQATPVPRPPDATTVLPLLTGEIPSALDPPSGCRFHTRCPVAIARCSVDPPVLEGGDDQPSHRAACHLVDRYHAQP